MNTMLFSWVAIPFVLLNFHSDVTNFSGREYN